jgi:hypothetical protein
MPEDVMRYPFNWALLQHSPGGGNQVKMRSCGFNNVVDVYNSVEGETVTTQVDSTCRDVM